VEQEGGSSFGPNFWCHNSVLEQEGAKEGVHKVGAPTSPSSEFWGPKSVTKP